MATRTVNSFLLQETGDKILLETGDKIILSSEDLLTSTIVGGTGGKATRHIATRYPVEKGLTGGTQKQTGSITNLVPENSNILSRNRRGL
tara:strand:+ start:2857 stop:3126 length:270 start_codon:yes stop_codon:yes gene_type:complete